MYRTMDISQVVDDFFTYLWVSSTLYYNYNNRETSIDIEVIPPGDSQSVGLRVDTKRWFDSRFPV